MSFDKIKEDLCTKLALKWKRFLAATEQPTVKTKADLSVSVCTENEENEVDVLNGKLDSRIPLRDLVATFVIISFICSLLRAIFGRR